ncbi:MAG: NAD(P)/FAD-dependent oxidoreductase [Candidatus Micrarchaeia archaeon]
MRTYDIAVVGAGPAGSSAARVAAEAGAKVILIERKKEIGNPVRCGEGIGKHWLDEIGLKVPPRAICAELNGAILFGPNMKSIKIKTDETKGYVLDRNVFDRELAIDAARVGAEILVKAQVVDIEGNTLKVAHMGEKNEIKASVIIAADGGESVIARKVGINSTATLYDTDFGVEYEMANVECTDLIEIYFGRSVAPRGYVWVFPKGKDVANVGVGIGGLEQPNAISYLEKFIKGHPDRFKDAQPVAVKAGVIPVGAPLETFVKGNVMVVGTAAHQVDPIHGGGICLAIDAGLMAGKVAAKCINEKKVSESSLKEYEKIWRSKRESKHMKRLALRKAVEKLDDDDFNVIFSSLDENDLDLLLKGNYAPVVQKVLLRRPQLLKILSPLSQYGAGELIKAFKDW